MQVRLYKIILPLQCTGFQVTLLRGAEWAATGKVSQKYPKDFPSSAKFSMRPTYKEVSEKAKKKSKK